MATTISQFGADNDVTQNVGAAVTAYIPVASGCIDSTVISNSAESTKQITYRTAGTLNKLFCSIITNGITATSTYLVRKNAANGNQSISIGASISGDFEDSANSDNVAAGDKLAIQVNGGATGTNLVIMCSRTLFTPTVTASTTKMGLVGSFTLSAASTTSFYPWSGSQNSADSTGQLTESNVLFTIEAAGTLSDLQANCSANTRGSATTVTSRKNSAAGNQSVSITGSTTGIFEDITHTDSYVAGDTVDYAMKTGTGTGSVTVIVFSSEYAATDTLSFQTAMYLYPGGAGVSPGNVYYMLTGTYLGAVNETRVRSSLGVDTIASKLELKVLINTTTAGSTFTLTINGTNGTLTLSVGSGASGFFLDSTHTDSLSSSTNVDVLFAVGTGGAMTLGALGMVYKYNPRAVPNLIGSGMVGGIGF